MATKNTPDTKSVPPRTDDNKTSAGAAGAAASWPFATRCMARTPDRSCQSQGIVYDWHNGNNWVQNGWRLRGLDDFRFEIEHMSKRKRKGKFTVHLLDPRRGLTFEATDVPVTAWRTLIRWMEHHWNQETQYQPTARYWCNTCKFAHHDEDRARLPCAAVVVPAAV